MGAGKSTIGRSLAKRLKRRFVDMDEEIVALSGRSIPRIFQEDGEAAFRRLEADTLRRLCAAEEALVIATGGGVVLDAANRRLLREGIVVWLDASPGVVAARTAGDANRPLLAGVEPLQKARALDRERRPLYADVADHRVPSGEMTVEEAVDDILAFLRRQGD